MGVFNVFPLALLAASCISYRPPRLGETAIPVLADTARCKTACGLVIDNMDPAQCGALMIYEDQVIAAFRQVALQENVCGMLNGWRLVLVDSENGVWSIGRRWVHAATVCDSQLTFLGEAPVGRRSALAHEIGHVLDCKEPGPPATALHQHNGWRNRGFCLAIQRASDLDIPCEHDAVPHPESQRAAH